ncbi:hypothetical protein UlMin_002517 [Ulmus minor]
MGSKRFEIEKFNGKGDFGMWRKKMRAILVQHKCAKALGGEKDLLDSLSAKEKQDLMETAYSTIQLFGFKMDQSKSLEDNLDDFTNLNIELANADSNEALSDENQAIIVLNFLPNSYKDLKAAIKYGRDSLTLEDVLGALRSREMEMRSEKRASNGEGLNVRGRLERKDRSNKGREGYESADVLAVTTKESRGEWILDLGCTFHMCPRSDLFNTYQSIDGGKVLMGNDEAYKVIGIGTVKLKMFDGQIRTLSNVRLIPDFKRNLISLKKHHGLYSLIGSTITGSSTFSTPIEQDKAKLLKFSSGVHTSNGTLDYVHYDVWGPARVNSHGGNRYFITIIDDFSRKADAVTIACFLINRCPSTTIGLKTPKERWNGRPSKYDNLKVFGCTAYAHLDIGKLDPRAKKAPERYEYSDVAAYTWNTAMEESDFEPLNYHQAMMSDDSIRWKTAMEEEMSSLHHNKTWVLVKKPKSQKVVGCKWIFKKKHGLLRT